jgi:hypothetical protein
MTVEHDEPDCGIIMKQNPSASTSPVRRIVRITVDDDEGCDDSSSSNLEKEDGSGIALLLKEEGKENDLHNDDDDDSDEESGGISLPDTAAAAGLVSGALRKQEQPQQHAPPRYWSSIILSLPFSLLRYANSRRGGGGSSTRILGHVMFLVCLGMGGFLVLDHYFSPATSPPPSSPQQQPPLGRAPFSLLDPALDLNLAKYPRPIESRLPLTVDHFRHVQTTVRHAIPTNAWYQNLILLRCDNDSAQQPLPSIYRAYTIPYLVDAGGPIPGLRIHVVTANNLVATDRTVQVAMEPQESYGLVLGAAQYANDSWSMPFAYTVQHMTPLAITLEWGNGGVRSCVLAHEPPCWWCILENTHPVLFLPFCSFIVLRLLVVLACFRWLIFVG